MGQTISRDERRWLEDRAARLRRMTAALDDDLDQVEQVEWSLFWQDMRRLYTRTSIHLHTALETRDQLNRPGFTGAVGVDPQTEFWAVLRR